MPCPTRSSLERASLNGGSEGKAQRQNVGGMRVLTVTILAMGFGLCVSGCGVSLAPCPAGSVAGRRALYDYSPSVIQSGNLQQVWWCGEGQNPNVGTQFTDTIQYESIDLTTGARNGPMEVLAATPGAWDPCIPAIPKLSRAPSPIRWAMAKTLPTPCITSPPDLLRQTITVSEWPFLTMA